MSTMTVTDDFLESQEFFDLMQRYRHAPDFHGTTAMVAAEAFEKVQDYIRVKTAPDALLVDVLLLCTNCKQPIKARIHTPNWLRVEWIGPEGECLRCVQEAKEADRGRQ